MKYFKYLTIAIVAMAMVACSDDEPKSTFTRDFNMIYPVLPAGHKSISKIERNYDNGASSVATATYDGDHLKSVNVVNRDKNGSLLNEETIHFDYNNGAIICDKAIQDVTYSFEVNSFGAIYKLTNVTTSRTASALVYNETGRLEVAQITTPSSTGTTKNTWMNGNITQWVTHDVNKLDSVVYEYGANAIPNKGGIDIPGNETITFTKFVCAFIYNAGLFGTTSAYLPTAIKKDLDYTQAQDQNSTDLQLKCYNISYTLDSEGYVQSYTTSETPKYTVKFTYR
jgi:hypothetical protein